MKGGERGFRVEGSPSPDEHGTPKVPMKIAVLFIVPLSRQNMVLVCYNKIRIYPIFFNTRAMCSSMLVGGRLSLCLCGWIRVADKSMTRARRPKPYIPKLL